MSRIWSSGCEACRRDARTVPAGPAPIIRMSTWVVIMGSNSFLNWWGFLKEGCWNEGRGGCEWGLSSSCQLADVRLRCVRVCTRVECNWSDQS